MTTDKQVCEILGWDGPVMMKNQYGDFYDAYPPVTTDPALAIKAMEQLERLPGCSSFYVFRTDGKWYTCWGKIDYVPSVEQEDASFSMAVCMAIVAAFEEGAKDESES